MTEIEALRQYWLQIGAAVAFVVWLVRLESRVNGNSSELRRVWKQRAEDLLAQRDARETTNKLLHELRQDIKTLLARRDT